MKNKILIFGSLIIILCLTLHLNKNSVKHIQKQIPIKEIVVKEQEQEDYYTKGYKTGYLAAIGQFGDKDPEFQSEYQVTYTSKKNEDIIDFSKEECKKGYTDGYHKALESLDRFKCTRQE